MVTEKPENTDPATARSLAPAVDYVEQAPELPKIQLPCLGCGRRDVLRYPYAEDTTTMWCVICGTLHHEDDDGKITASIPVLPATILEVFESGPAIDKIQEIIEKKKAEASGA